MFARRVTMKLKPNCVGDFTRRLEKDVIPLLRKQTGFKDEIVFVATGEKQATAISLWDRREDAEAYNNSKYAEIVKMLSAVVEGDAHIQSGEVASSTFHKIAAPAKS